MLIESVGWHWEYMFFGTEIKRLGRFSVFVEYSRQKQVSKHLETLSCLAFPQLYTLNQSRRKFFAADFKGKLDRYCQISILS